MAEFRWIKSSGEAGRLREERATHAGHCSERIAEDGSVRIPGPGKWVKACEFESRSGHLQWGWLQPRFGTHPAICRRSPSTASLMSGRVCSPWHVLGSPLPSACLLGEAASKDLAPKAPEGGLNLLLLGVQSSPEVL